MATTIWSEDFVSKAASFWRGPPLRRVDQPGVVDDAAGKRGQVCAQAPGIGSQAQAEEPQAAAPRRASAAHPSGRVGSRGLLAMLHPGMGLAALRLRLSRLRAEVDLRCFQLVFGDGEGLVGLVAGEPECAHITEGKVRGSGIVAPRPRCSRAAPPRCGFPSLRAATAGPGSSGWISGRDSFPRPPAGATGRRSGRPDSPETP